MSEAGSPGSRPEPSAPEPPGSEPAGPAPPGREPPGLPAPLRPVRPGLGPGYAAAEPLRSPPRRSLGEGALGDLVARVEEVAAGRARCKVAVGGRVDAHKGVNVPGATIPIPSLTDKDLSDLEFALTLGVDFVALSFVRSANDIRGLRELLQSAGSSALVIAKIEKAEALEELEEIIGASDAVMVARGDLGVEIGPAAVPLVQKRIIISALEHGKPAITATQMLESMIHSPEPTRAEAWFYLGGAYGARVQWRVLRGERCRSPTSMCPARFSPNPAMSLMTSMAPRRKYSWPSASAGSSKTALSCGTATEACVLQ